MNYFFSLAIILRYFAFLLELTFLKLLSIYDISFCARLFQVRTCVLCVQVATPQRSVNKQSREKRRHFSLYVENISGYRGKKEEGA